MTSRGALDISFLASALGLALAVAAAPAQAVPEYSQSTVKPAAEEVRSGTPVTFTVCHPQHRRRGRLDPGRRPRPRERALRLRRGRRVVSRAH